MSDHQEINHSARAHAILSPSGASRWMACTVSARLEEDFAQVSGDSIFAAEGTLAHEFGELGVRLITKDITKKEFDKRIAPFIAHELYYPEMEEEVQIYVDYVYGQLMAARKVDRDAVLLIEQRVDLTHLIEEGSGMCDAIIVACGTMEVIDLKFGKGVRVSAEQNKQLMLYGLGALYQYELAYDIRNVKLTIVQPRLDSISSWDIQAQDLRDFGNNEVMPAAKLAYAGEGEQVAGEHCRFCKVKGSCRAFAVKQLEALKADFSPENISDVTFENRDHLLLSEEEILAVYAVRSSITEFVNAVEGYVLKEALDGKQWAGYKLVEGRSNRAWLDAKAVEEKLIGAKFPKDKILSEPKLLGIGAIEKVVGKSNFDGLLGSLVVKPRGKPTLVEESDKRPIFKGDLASDFNDVGNEVL